MRGGVVAWEYAEVHLPYWQRTGVPVVNYVRAARALRCLSCREQGPVLHSLTATWGSAGADGPLHCTARTICCYGFVYLLVVFEKHN
jgi:hypothetical protein